MQIQVALSPPGPWLTGFLHRLFLYCVADNRYANGRYNRHKRSRRSGIIDWSTTTPAVKTRKTRNIFLRQGSLPNHNAPHAPAHAITPTSYAHWSSYLHARVT